MSTEEEKRESRKMTIKKQNNKVLSLIVFSVIALALIFLWALNNQLSKDTSNKSVNNSTENLKATNNIVETNQDSNPLDQSTEARATSDTSTKNPTDDSLNLSPVKDETTKVFSSSEQKKVQQVIGQFENSFAKSDYQTVFKLFMAEVRDNEAEADVQAKSPSAPKSFAIQSIDTRSDSTVFVQVNETRANGSTEERFMELAPVDKGYQISRYFSKLKETTYSGFLTDEALKQNSVDR